jgi:hypothetical protein
MKAVCIFAILFVFGASAHVQPEAAGFFDVVNKGINIAGKVMNHPVMKQTVMPLAKNLANQQLAKKGVNIQFEESEQAGFMDFMKKAVNVGKQVMNHPVMKETVMPLAKNLANQQLQKKGVNLQFAEEAGFMDFIGKAVKVGTQIAKNPLVQQGAKMGFGMVQQQLAKKRLVEESLSFTDFMNKAINVGKTVVPQVLPHIKEVISTTSKLDFKDKNAVLNHFIDTGKKSFELGVKIAPSVAGAIKN